MTKSEAITILGQACMSVQATWEGHLKLQEALKVVSEDKKQEVVDAVTRG